MDTAYALLVGIDAYWSLSVPILQGCVNDIEDAHLYLTENVGDRVESLLLRNAEATRDAVIEGFRRHLARAGVGDTALFWFSGHGSTLPVPDYWRHLEESGTTMQTLVCVDSRIGGVPDLLDKELAVLIREVAARGPHVVLVLDCCHAGGASRAIGRVRQTAPAAQPLDPSSLLASVRELATADTGGRADHVSLAACQAHELAREVSHDLPDGQTVQRGVFSLGLLAELRRPGEARTYRELIAATRGQVENAVDHQNPTLHPVAESIVDQPFLGGRVRPPVAKMSLWHRHGGWRVDAGRCHGFPAGPAGTVRLAVHGSEPVREVRVVSVLADHSTVEPIDWIPAVDETYPVVLSAMPLPETTVAVGGRPEDDDEVAERVAAAIRTAGPGGKPSPFVRLVSRGDRDRLAQLVVAAPTATGLSVTSADGIRLADCSIGPDPSGRPDVVATLEHIAQWRRIRALANPLSRLAGQVRVEIIPPEPTDLGLPWQRRGRSPGASGAIELEYDRQRFGYVAPTVYVRIDNLSDRPLHCVLLDLTDRFRIHADLFPGAFIDAHASAAALGGDLVELTLPAGRDLRPGARVRDWLMLVVSEEKIDSGYFALPRLGEPGGRVPSVRGLVTVIEQLALSGRMRDADRRPSVARDWWTSSVALTTRVPDAVGHGWAGS